MKFIIAIESHRLTDCRLLVNGNMGAISTDGPWASSSRTGFRRGEGNFERLGLPCRAENRH